MAILIDRPLWWWRGERWSHLVSDADLDELHAFAERLGVPRRAFQGDHYDIPERIFDAAVAQGAEITDPREIVRRLRAAGLRLRPSDRHPHRPTNGAGAPGVAPSDEAPTAEQPRS